MRILDKLESYLGRFAIPGLVQFVAGLQLLTFVISMMLPLEARMHYQDFLRLDGARILHGEVWRLVTYIFVPGSDSVLFALFGAMFLMWLGRGLEQAWGPFRLNLYFIGGMLSVAIGSLICGFDESSLYLFQSLLLAFAVIYPNEEILLFMILPVKIKWIAWLDVAMMALAVLSAPVAIIPIFFSHLNFLIDFAPGFVRERMHLAKVAERRSRFDQMTSSGNPFFHQCTVCKKTEVDNPTLEFRVNDDGDEICSDCRKPR